MNGHCLSRAQSAPSPRKRVRDRSGGESRGGVDCEVQQLDANYIKFKLPNALENKKKGSRTRDPFHFVRDCERFA